MPRAISRYGPDSNLTERDRALLGDLYYLRVATTGQLFKAYFSAPDHPYSRQYCVRRLRKLEEYGYLESSENGVRLDTLWSLTKSGLSIADEERAIVDWDGYFDKERRDTKSRITFPTPYENRNIRQDLLRHHLLVNDVFVEMMEKCPRSEKIPWRWTASRETRMGEGRSIVVRPDAIVSVANAHYFIEYDTGSERPKDLAAKLEKYERYFLSPDAERFIGERRIVFVIDAKQRSAVRRRMGTIYSAALSSFASLRNVGSMIDVMVGTFDEITDRMARYYMLEDAGSPSMWGPRLEELKEAAVRNGWQLDMIRRADWGGIRLGAFLRYHRGEETGKSDFFLYDMRLGTSEQIRGLPAFLDALGSYPQAGIILCTDLDLMPDLFGWINRSIPSGLTFIPIDEMASGPLYDASYRYDNGEWIRSGFRVMSLKGEQ